MTEGKMRVVELSKHERREAIAFAPELVLYTVRKYGALSMSQLVEKLENTIPVSTIFGATLMQLKLNKLYELSHECIGASLQAVPLPDDDNVIYLLEDRLPAQRSS